MLVLPRRRAAIATTSPNQDPRASSNGLVPPLDVRGRRPVRSVSEPLPRRVPVGSVSGPKVDCVDCGKPSRNPQAGWIQLTYGWVEYTKRGPQYYPYEDDVPQWLCTACAVRRKVDPATLELDKCRYCGEQFFKSETAVRCISGTPGGRQRRFGGAAHWACLCDDTGLWLGNE
jgi:hypothetical protein